MGGLATETPMRDPQYSTDPGVQLQLRELRARKEPMRIFPLGAGPIGDRFRVHSASDRIYEVEIRDPGARVNLCTCPDFRINRLGTCKHIETILRRPRLAERCSPRRARAFVFLDRRRDSIALHPADGKGLLTPFRQAFFDGDGAFRGQTPAEVQRMLEAAARHPARVLTVAPEVTHELGRRREREAWARYADSVRARARGGEDPFAFLAAPLYPYQVEGSLHLLDRRRAILGDEMGLGKTVQAAAAAAFLLREGHARRVLVVCPASLKHQWDLELRRFAAAGPTVVAGTAARRHEAYRSEQAFVIAHYEQIYRDRRFLQDSDLHWDIVILDEAQRIKNWRAKTSDAVKDLRRRCRFAFVLSGTPLENNLEELYSVCQFVDPTLLGPLWDFHDKYYRLDEDGHVQGYRNLDSLRSRIAGIVLRRTKETVRLQLPERIVNRFYVPLTPQQRALHDELSPQVAQLVDRMKRRPLSDDERRRLTMLLTLLRRVCDAAEMAKGPPGPIPKLEELDRILEELVVVGGHKALVFSEWTDMLDHAATLLRKRRLGHGYLHGGVPAARRGDLIERFHSDPTCRVFLSTESGGLGLNLQAASVVIHLDLPWNPARLEQRNARADRIGQTRTVHVVTLVAEDSIESRIERLLESKREIFDAVFRADGAAEVDLPSLSGRMADLLAEVVDAPAAGTDVAREEASAVARARPVGGTSEPIAPAPAAPIPARSMAAMASALVQALERPAATRATRALQAAFHLRDGGFAAESVAQSGKAILAALGDLLARHGIPIPPDPQVPAAVRRHLVPAGRLPRPLLDRALSSLSWSQGFEAETDVPPELAAELLAEVGGIVAEIGRA